MGTRRRTGLAEIEPDEATQRLIADSTSRLVRDVARLTDADIARATALPGWTRGHVLSHLTRQVDALERLFQWARTGVVTPQYPSRGARDAEIAAGADRSAADLLTDVRTTAESFQRTIAGLPIAAWHATVQPFTGELCTPKRLLVIRIRELEVHHVDLGVGYELDHVTPEAGSVILGDVCSYLASHDATPDLRIVQTDGPGVWQFGTGGPVVSGRQGALLGWLTGRSGGAGLDSVAPIPALPPWI